MWAAVSSTTRNSAAPFGSPLVCDIHRAGRRCVLRMRIVVSEVTPWPGRNWNPL